jgi:hypothetical protein
MVKRASTLTQRIVLQRAQNRLNQSVSWSLGECARAKEGFIGPWKSYPRRHSWLLGLEIRATERLRPQLGGLS